MLAAVTSTFARLGDTQKEFEQANPNFKYTGESPGNEPNTLVRQYAGDGTVAQIAFGADGKVIMEAYSDLSGKLPESSLVPVAKSYGYDFSVLEKISVSAPWKALVLHRDFWFSPDHKFCVGIGDVVMNDSKIVSTMTVAGEQVAPTLYQNSTEKRSDEPAKRSATMTTFILILVAVVIIFFGFSAPTLFLTVLNAAGLPGALIAYPRKDQVPARPRYLLGTFISTLGQSYLYLAFTAFIVETARYLAHAHGVVFWPLGFLVAFGPIYSCAAVAHAEATSSPNAQVVAVTLTSFIAIIAFFIFAFFPSVIALGWPWIPYFSR